MSRRRLVTRVSGFFIGAAASCAVAVGASGPILAQTPQTTTGQQTSQGQRQGGGATGQRGGANQTQQQRDPNQTAETQPAQTGTGVIAGTVKSSGRPVRRARVSLTGSGGTRGGTSMLTDDQGHFSFATLVAGQYRLIASKTAYVDAIYGQKSPGRPGTPIQLTDGQQMDAEIQLYKGGVLTGVVVDDAGEPSPGTQVRAMRFVMQTGQKTLQQVGLDSTDDRGMYRIYGLQPGEYVVSAVPRNATLGGLQQQLAGVQQLLQQAQDATGGNGGGGRGAGGRGGAAGGGLGQLGGRALGNGFGQNANVDETTAYAPVYYPGTTSATNAQSITLAAAEERQNVDFQLQLVSTARIAGTVSAPGGAIPQGVQISLVDLDQAQSGVSFQNNTARVNQAGTFTFTNVTPGRYTVTARGIERAPADPNAPAATVTTQNGRGGRGGRGGFGPGGMANATVLWASADVTMDGHDQTGVSLVLQPGMVVSGRIAFTSGLAPPTDLTTVRVTITSQSGANSDFAGAIPPGQVDASGNFTIKGVPPGKYILRANIAGGQRGAGGAAAQTGGWVLQSSLVNGRDSLDFPFEIQPNQDVSGAVITFGNTTTQLSGTVLDPTGKPGTDFTIIVFPSDNQYWVANSRRITSTRPGTDGTYSVRSLPPGDYLIGAVTDVEPGEWYDPTFLKQLQAASAHVLLAAGDKKTQNLQVPAGGGD